MSSIVFFDTETSIETGQLLEIGAVKDDGSMLRTGSMAAFISFAGDADYLCGHNIFAHDLKAVGEDIRGASGAGFIDTLYISPLMFPARPHHKLLKDDKLETDEINNPLNDALKAKELFLDEVSAYNRLGSDIREIYRRLLGGIREFRDFFTYADGQKAQSEGSEVWPASPGYIREAEGAAAAAGRPALDMALYETAGLIEDAFAGRICENAGLPALAAQHPAELAYCLALVNAGDRHAAAAPWVSRSFPAVNEVINKLRGRPCGRCAYCREHFSLHTKLKEYFGYDDFRRYNGEPLQEEAVRAAVDGRSLLAIFPTGGGKSLTFQLPALIAGETSRGLTVVISPLQSLMKDQVDSLSRKGIIDAVTINGSIDPVGRKNAIEQVENGVASILYIAPESLRSATIERLLRSRNIARFVIDEAHCFSAWGQDFRVDYLYIGEFIRKLREDKQLDSPIPVSCFTATAKPKVISDIRDYFRQTCGTELDLFTTDAERTNLRYEVLFRENDEQKYQTLRELIMSRDCPAIVYVARTKRTRELAARLTADGIEAVAYHGKMPPQEKQESQEAFMSDRVRVIVATTAFGMGIDKDDVGLVIHYNISASLEDYVQEAGRAGRDPAKDADCYVLFNDDDINKHLRYLNETRLSINEIRQIWKAVKQLSGKRDRFTRSALEIARAAGWDDTTPETETKVRAAISALEQAGYVKRGRNVPHIYADGIAVHNMNEASERIRSSKRFSGGEEKLALRIMSLLITKRYTARAGSEDAESRVDYIADRLGEKTESVMRCLISLKEEGLISDSMDMSAYAGRSGKKKTEADVKRLADLESWLIDHLPASGTVTYKELNSAALEAGVRSSVRDIRTVTAFWMRRKYIRKSVIGDNRRFYIEKTDSFAELRDGLAYRTNTALFITEYLYGKASAAVSEPEAEKGGSKKEIPFSVLELKNEYNTRLSLLTDARQAGSGDIMLALTYLKAIDALDIDGGFIVLYNAMQIERRITNNKKQYQKEDYRQMDEYYSQRRQQIHIAGEYARIMAKDYEDAQTFVSDYFSMDYMLFIRKYFKGKRRKEIDRSVTSERYNRLFESLSPVQRRIIDDDRSKYIVAAAGPGSGKTKVLVHKLASLLLLEDVRSDQLLMLTFSRSAATDFRQRLVSLIGSAASYVDIRTFHSFCFDITGETGDLDGSADVIARAVSMIKKGTADPGRITRSVLVIDEAQDMDEDSFALVRALMEKNEYMRVIAVGDDDQNIYAFRDSDPRYLKSLITDYKASVYELTDNYRSDISIVSCAEQWAQTISERLKTEPVRAVSSEDGSAEIRRLFTADVTMPLIGLLKNTYRGGSCCVMTRTNEEAVLASGILRREGYRTRLIQSNDDFSLTDLHEMRTFIELLTQSPGSSAAISGAGALIPRDIWENAAGQLRRTFEHSACLPECLRLIHTFGAANRKLFLSDFTEFLRESDIADFTQAGADTILVSTIHGSKGREFDAVYIVLNNYSAASDDDRRVLYVGMTRAKNTLYICTNSGALDTVFRKDAGSGLIRYTADRSRQPLPDEAVIQLSHRDVNLGYFRLVYGRVRRMRSGDELEWRDDALYAGGKPVAKLSRKAAARIDALRAKGFEVCGARVRYVVYWKGREDENESMILLPDIYLRRSRPDAV